MWNRTACWSVLLLLGPSLCGCGTVMNLRSPTSARKRSDIATPRASVYGGVKLDAAAGRRSFQSSDGRLGPLFAGGYVWGIDLPLSAVADTLTLPITVPASISRGVDEYYFPKPSQNVAAEGGELDGAG